MLISLQTVKDYMMNDYADLVATTIGDQVQNVRLLGPQNIANAILNRVCTKDHFVFGLQSDIAQPGFKVKKNENFLLFEYLECIARDWPDSGEKNVMQAQLEKGEVGIKFEDYKNYVEIMQKTSQWVGANLEKHGNQLANFVVMVVLYRLLNKQPATGLYSRIQLEGFVEQHKVLLNLVGGKEVFVTLPKQTPPIVYIPVPGLGVIQQLFPKNALAVQFLLHENNPFLFKVIRRLVRLTEILNVKIVESMTAKPFNDISLALVDADQLHMQDLDSAMLYLDKNLDQNGSIAVLSRKLKSSSRVLNADEVASRFSYHFALKAKEEFEYSEMLTQPQNLTEMECSMTHLGVMKMFQDLPKEPQKVTGVYTLWKRQ